MKKFFAGIAAAAVAISTMAVSASAVDAEVIWNNDTENGNIAFISTANLVTGTEYTLLFTIDSPVEVPMEDRGACVWVRWAKTDHNSAFGVDAADGTRNYVDKVSNVLPAGIQGLAAGTNEIAVSFVYGEANDYMSADDYADASIIAISMGGGIDEGYTLHDIRIVEGNEAPAAAEATEDEAEEEVEEEVVEDEAEEEVEEEVAEETEAEEVDEDAEAEDATEAADDNAAAETTAATAAATVNTAAQTAADKASADTGIEGVAVIAGLAILATGAVVISRKK